MSAQSTVVAEIARPYAAALFDLASEADALPAVEQSLDAMAALIEESADFQRFLRSPVIAADAKSVAVDKILEAGKPAPLADNFLRLVAANGRLFALPSMIAAFKALAAEARGEVLAEVTSATALSAAQRDNLAETLKKKIGKTVTLKTHVDESLIGGLVVKVGSRMIDSSLNTKLTAMKIAMKEVG